MVLSLVIKVYCSAIIKWPQFEIPFPGLIDYWIDTFMVKVDILLKCIAKNRTVSPQLEAYLSQCIKAKDIAQKDKKIKLTHYCCLLV